VTVKGVRALMPVALATLSAARGACLTLVPLAPGFFFLPRPLSACRSLNLSAIGTRVSLPTLPSSAEVAPSGFPTPPMQLPPWPGLAGFGGWRGDPGQPASRS